MTRSNWLGWAGAAVMLGAAAAQGEAVRGDINNWQNPSVTLWMATNVAFQGDAAWSCTITSTASRASSGVKFDQSGDWANQWGAGTSAGVNSTIGTATKNGGNLTFAETNTHRYTFRLAGFNDWTDRAYVILATASNPVTITAVEDNSA